MEYISFDIECGDGRHICEFGFVRFDEAFHVIEKECWLINPERRITLSGKKSRGDMKLHFSEEEYYAAPPFPRFYDRIRDLLCAPERKIVGFSLINDCGFLNTACARYQLTPLKFKYLDFQKLYRGYSMESQDASVGKFAEALGIEGIEFHKSDDDAYAVVLGLKKIAEKEGLSLFDTLSFMQERRTAYLRQIAREKAQNRLKKTFEGNKKLQNIFLRNYSQKLKRNLHSNDPVFAGQWVCIGSSLQTDRFPEFVALVKILADHGAGYTARTSSCSVFIYDDVTDDARYNSAQICLKSGKNILFLSLPEALGKLGVGEEDLKTVDLLSFFYEEPAELREVKTSDGGATIQEMLRSNKKKKRRRGGKKRRKKTAQAAEVKKEG